MNKLESWIFKRIVRKEVRQGGQLLKISNMYGIIRDACREEYAEDNEPTLDDFLRECFESNQFEDKYKDTK